MRFVVVARGQGRVIAPERSYGSPPVVITLARHAYSTSRGAVFEWRTPWVPSAGAGGAVDLVIADAAHAHAADAPTLTTTWLLTVADAAHAHVADAPTLSTEWLLAPADATHAHAADNLTLSDAPALLIAEALHAHTADGVTMTVDAWLVLADATHGHTADNVVLFVPGGASIREVLRLSSALRQAVTGSSTLTRTVALASNIDAESTTP